MVLWFCGFLLSPAFKVMKIVISVIILNSDPINKNKDESNRRIKIEKIVSRIYEGLM